MNRSAHPRPAAMTPLVAGGGRFERPRRRRPNGDDPAAGRERGPHRERRGLVDFISLGFDAVILDLFDPNRLECAVADVQRDLDDLDAPPPERAPAAPG